jgi:hypothetical protein
MRANRRTLEQAAMCATDKRTDDPPYALADQHIKALELAIRAESYEIIMADSDTGEIKFTKEPHFPS